ncbi:MAG: type II toxin-antitoxin system HicB family antitoxin [Terrisporobacter sp.]
MYKDFYNYISIFTPDENNTYSIEVPDLPGCISCGDNLDDGIKMITEAMGLYLYDMEKDNDDIPAPSSPEVISQTLEPGQFMLQIHVVMPLHRNAIENYSVRTTVTLPQWIKEEALRNDINFSQVLQDAIKDTLGLHHN